MVQSVCSVETDGPGLKRPVNFCKMVAATEEAWSCILGCHPWGILA